MLHLLFVTLFKSCADFENLFILQTGPKGVLKDYQRFKQLQREQREEEKEELALLTKKFSITCRTNVIYL